MTSSVINLTIRVNVARRNLQIFVVLVPINRLVQDSHSGGQEIVLIVIERGETGVKVSILFVIE